MIEYELICFSNLSFYICIVKQSLKNLFSILLQSLVLTCFMVENVRLVVIWLFLKIKIKILTVKFIQSNENFNYLNQY